MPQMDFCNTIRVEPDGRRGVKLAFDPTETLAAPERITLNVPLEVVGAIGPDIAPYPFRAMGEHDSITKAAGFGS
jgi:hypothetical protein